MLVSTPHQGFLADQRTNAQKDERQTHGRLLCPWLGVCYASQLGVCSARPDLDLALALDLDLTLALDLDLDLALDLDLDLDLERALDLVAKILKIRSGSQMKVQVMRIRSVQKSSKSELSSGVFDPVKVYNARPAVISFSYEICIS